MNNEQEIRLQGRRVLVTGAARGLGAAFARALVDAGAQVVLSDVLHARGQALAAELGAQAHYVPMDLSDAMSIQAGVDQAAAAMGGLDGLINNAAITNSGGKTMDQLEADMWDRVMDVNVRGTWQATVAATPHLAASGSGRVVNLASDTAMWGAPRLMAYIASKGAVIAMTRGMARELGAQGITVNAIAPGLTLVEATEYVPADRHDYYLKGRAVQRPQVPEDVTAAVLFLMTRASGFITGQLLPVNGGFVMN
ncbi:MAG: SDR family oxidoreductase [Rhodoferax sp.]|jgi:NAD(P)-dependent dehydrogenase (short-subunit alcohol dehydrogenase family)|nr:SDR family oxidoreductase [Rhodoferax sp.]MBP9929551.1 SDR family oxidoreductase [Rhodoferax sp.]HQX60113.1 SDR family oxidoreductase [Burkholderiaceae bacterium]HQZ07154.1 SDR family oxidoreductase [Burkholderiaceae bacterium]HRA61776.1 SDR family oxidoreductase [Burkholderiaceae bacterium]